jgi:outer membrane usher protein FimD/PapC
VTGLIRGFSCTLIVMWIAGCATPAIQAPESVALNTRTFSPEYSSFNARVLSDAGALDTSFRTSLDRDVEVATRLESAYTYQFDDSREQLRVGDAVSSSGMWGSAVRYGGMQYGTKTTARADVITASDLATGGLAVLPTVADALFNMTGDPGSSLSQHNLSVTRAWRTGDLIASDALGRSIAINAPLIASTRLADPGCGDVSVGAGRVRRDYAITSNEYGPTFANTTITCGLPLGFTVEGHGEYLADSVTAVGIGVARQLGPLGVASLAYASSQAAEGTGWFAKVGFERQGDLISIALRSRLQSREFRSVGALVSDDPVMQRDLASVGVNVMEGARLSVAYATQVTWSRERMNFIALQQSLSMGRGSLSMSAGHSLADDFGSSVFVSYKRPFGFGMRAAPSLIDEFIPLLPRDTSSFD